MMNLHQEIESDAAESIQYIEEHSKDFTYMVPPATESPFKNYEISPKASNTGFKRAAKLPPVFEGGHRILRVGHDVSKMRLKPKQSPENNSSAEKHLNKRKLSPVFNKTTVFGQRSSSVVQETPTKLHQNV